jgi:hypothetical protein
MPFTLATALSARGWGHREGEQYYTRWCFADPDLAAAFAKEFDA